MVALMSEAPTLRGFATISLWPEDLEVARRYAVTYNQHYLEVLAWRKS
jgi:hypothetical protein